MKWYLPILFLALCDSSPAAAPSSVTMMNGEVVYITGHKSTDTAIASGSWINPNIWADGTAPTMVDNVFIPAGVTVEMHCPMECKSLVVGGTLNWRHQAYMRVSTITGLPGAVWEAGTAEAPIAYQIDWLGADFDAEDKGEFGVGLVWCGHGNFRQYGYVLPNGLADEWYLSNGERGDSHYETGPPPENAVAAVNLDSNSIQWKWDGYGNRPHCMFMHGSCDMSCTTIRGFGRTDKSEILSATNKVGRYLLHLHRGGENVQTNLRRVYGANSPGWCIVNHSSNVVATECAAVDTYGAGFVCEAADEVGAWNKCTVIGMTSTDKSPTKYERAIIGDRWFSGEGIVPAARVSVTDCLIVDVGAGVASHNSAITETIGGVQQKQTYDDGTATNNAAQLPIKRVRVVGFDRNGVWQHWVAQDGPPCVIEDCEFTGEGSGVLTSYGAGVDVRNCQINADYGVDEVNMGAPAVVSLTDCRLVVRKAANDSKDSGMQTTRFTNCDIVAGEVGFLFVASKHPNCRRKYYVDGGTVAAPKVYELIHAKPPYKQHTGPNQVNEVWMDGVQILYPWQK